MPKFLDIGSAVGGAVRFAHLGHIVFTIDAVDIDERQHGLTAVFNSKENAWGKSPGDRTISWLPLSATVCDHPQCQMVAIGAWGNVLVDGKGDFHEELIHDHDKVPPERRGKLLRVRGIGRRAYAVGMGRMVYRRDDVNRWTAIDQGCLAGSTKPKAKNDVEAYKAMLVGFNGIDGFSEDDIYAAGLQGELWHRDAKKWRQLDSPTNAILNDVICAGDGQVYACGDRGLLVQGRADQWRIASDPAFTIDIWNLCWFAGKLYLATLKGLFVREGNKIVPVDFGDDDPDTTCHLSARDGIMWSIGAKDIMQFDGKSWTRID